MNNGKRIDPLVMASALVLSENQQKDIHSVKRVVFDNLQMVGAMMQPVLPMFSSAIQQIKLIEKEETSVKSLFSGFGLLAAKCRETAALNFILDSDIEKYEKAQARLKELFDYSEHFCDQTEGTHNTQQQLIINSSSMVKLIEYCKSKDAEFRFDELDGKHTYISNGQQNGSYDFVTKFTNKYGITFDVSCKGIEYIHPNELKKAVSRFPFFKGDFELVVDYFNKLFAHYGFTLLDYTEKAHVEEHVELFEIIYNRMLIIPELESGSIRTMEVKKTGLFIQLVEEQYRKDEGSGYFMIFRSPDVHLSLHVDDKPSGITIKYQSHVYPKFTGWDHVSMMTSQIKMKQFIEKINETKYLIPHGTALTV